MDKTMNKNKQFNKNNKGKMQSNTVLRSVRIREVNRPDTYFGVFVSSSVTTNKEVVEQRVFKVFDDICGDAAPVNYETIIRDVESLDTIEIISALEEEFGIDILDEDAQKIENVGDVIDYIKSIY
jgi:acyl carrier protein